jgi:hypothetical protein
MFIEDSEKITKLVCPSSVSAKDKNIINFVIKIALHNFTLYTELFSKLATPVTKPGVVQFSLYTELFSKLETTVTYQTRVRTVLNLSNCVTYLSF